MSFEGLLSMGRMLPIFIAGAQSALVIVPSIIGLWVLFTTHLKNTHFPPRRGILRGVSFFPAPRQTLSRLR